MNNSSERGWVSQLLLNGEVKASDISKAFGELRVLQDATLSVPAGTSLAITGVSGSGKSTLLHLLAGIEVPDSGCVRYGTQGEEIEVSALPEKHRTQLRQHHLGFVFQRGLLLPELTAQENVALPCLLSGLTKQAALTSAIERLSVVGLGGYWDRRPGQLSGGEAQRVAIARAIATQPKIVFADEPTAALDPDTGFTVMQELLSATTRQGRTLLVVTHDRAVAAQCDRMVEVRDGRVWENGASR